MLKIKTGWRGVRNFTTHPSEVYTLKVVDKGSNLWIFFVLGLNYPVQTQHVSHFSFKHL